MSVKIVRSKNYNYDFNYKTGLFLRWGSDLKDDPSFSPFGPEILDIEISTICHGIHNNPCPWCYKSNTSKGINMTFETFKTIFHKIPKNLTQIAFGIGDIDSNPDLFMILQYCRENDYNKVVPNITINGYNISDKIADKLARYCGAVAVSNYDKDLTYNTVKKLTNRINIDKNFLNQVNVHQLLAKETFKSTLLVLKDIKNDHRLEELNAIVFLSLKQKGIRNTYHPISITDFKKLITFSENRQISYGMDSCSALKFFNCIQNNSNYETYKTYIEACESGLFSLYINVKGESYFCSFVEGENEFPKFDIVNCCNFLKDIWFHFDMIEWREKLIASTNNNSFNCRECLLFEF